MSATTPTVLASVDLGSNSFRLQVCENHDGRLKIIDSFKQMVRFAAGLDEHKNLDQASQERALDCLARFGERLQNFHPEQVRAVATNTFRVAKNIDQFLPKAEAALGFPIEIIAGREEARLIYTGVVHTLPPNGEKMLVVDIGGGSTEFVIGADLHPTNTESLPLGCVSYSIRFFRDGKINTKNFQAAITTARSEIQRIRHSLKQTGWDFAVGTSGSAKAIRDVIAALGKEDDLITHEAMSAIAAKIIQAGSVKKAKLPGLKPERVEVFAGGLAVMMAAFEELGIATMMVTEAALRDGVFYDLIGRTLNEDMRDQTTLEFQHRYHVCTSQAARVAATAKEFMNSLCLSANTPVAEVAYWQQYINWAAQLHEIGIDIAHTGYHKHSAYILENADMPGFSRKEQKILSLLTLSHRGDLRKMATLINDPVMWYAILSLRLAALFCRARLDLELPPFTQLKIDNNASSFVLRINESWLQAHPLVNGALDFESEQWRKLGMPLHIKPQ